MTLEIGTRLGHYRILALLGRGGMADVYRAEDERLGREVALKALPPEFARDVERVERFEREVRAAARLAHPNIVTVYEFGQGESQHFYTMALMPGGDLKERIRAHPEGMAETEVRSVAAAVARALDYAHGQGFVHRDVKPENILFWGDGSPQLTDFGIARAIGSGTRMTATGMSIGSPHYMSPEQARGGAVDRRSDLYSLGVVLYEMLTGGVPFDAADTLAVAYAHVNDPVPELPGALGDWQPVVDRLLAKVPEDRYGSAGELVEVLASDGRHPQPHKRVTPVRREFGPTTRAMEATTRLMEPAKLSRSQWAVLPVVVGVLLAVTALAVGSYVALRDTSDPKDERGSGGGAQVSSTLVRPEPERPDLSSTAEIPVEFGSRQPTRPKDVPPATDRGVTAEAALGLDRAERQGIQEGLAAAGFDPGGPDGLFGPGTRAALRAWQRAEGKPATGYLTRASAAELRARAAAERQRTAERRRAAFDQRIAATRRRMDATSKQLARIGYGPLTLDLVPANAQVRLLNHEASYKAGMNLPPGNYRVEVSAAGYETAVLTLNHGSSSTRKEVTLRQEVSEEESAVGIVDRYRRAAEQGDAEAQFKLGVSYANGEGVGEDDGEAAKWYRKAAEQGHAEAQFKLGVSYGNGWGVAKDEQEAAKWYRKAAEQGHAEAQFKLGVRYANGEGVREDDGEAVKWYRKAAEQGHALAQTNLGVMYNHGEGVAKDQQEAVKWYRRAAEQGNAGGQNNLGLMYDEGQGVAEDKREAVKWFRKAAEQGSAEAQFKLGVSYDNGWGVAKDEQEAVKWFRRAAEQGSAKAQYNLGHGYFKGEGVAKDEREAAKWIRKAAEQGIALAQTNLGFMYAYARGVAKDNREAVKWYRRAAEQGSATGQFNLGGMYAGGKGVPQDDREAVNWWRKAAEQGHADAQFNLGVCYDNGEGVAKDKREAMRWFRRAAKQGSARAQRVLKRY